MKISFIVPAYNEEFELPRTIAAIQAAANSVALPWEIVVVNDDSTDATARIAQEAGATLINIRRRQIAAARNAGAQAASGDVLFFVDADTRIAADHVRQALDALASGYVGGSARVRADGIVPLWGRLFLHVFSALYFANNLAAGAFVFTSRVNFQRIGGFDEELYVGEEVYFSFALKKLGRFKLLSLPVVTSGRKLRMYSARQILPHFFAILVRGKRAARKRENCHYWYDGRREITR
jgi:glycosyltransferase involved in cell wall biosynthesis